MSGSQGLCSFSQCCFGTVQAFFSVEGIVKGPQRRHQAWGKLARGSLPPALTSQQPDNSL